MDELPIFINMDHFKNQDPSAFQLSGCVSDEPVFTVVLTALADGTLLPPLLLFRGTSCSIPEGFPDNVLLEARPEGFTDQDCQHIWMDKVRVAAQPFAISLETCGPGTLSSCAGVASPHVCLWVIVAPADSRHPPWTLG